MANLARHVEAVLAAIKAGKLHDNDLWTLYYACKEKIDHG